MTLAPDDVSRAEDTGVTVADAMISAPKLCAATATVAQARDQLGSHVHAVLVVGSRRLLAVVEREDLLGAAPDRLARDLGRLEGRTVLPGDDLVEVTAVMAATGRRRLAVVDDDGRLVGLLCRQRSGRGFCCDKGVAERAAERAGG